MLPVYQLKHTAQTRQNPALAGLPYGLRVRVKTPSRTIPQPNLGLVWAETLQGRTIGPIPTNALERL